MKTPPQKAALPILCLSLWFLCVQAAPPPLPPEINPQDRVKPAQVREMFAVLPPMEPPNHERSDSELRSRIVTLNSDWLPEPGGTTRAKLFEDAEFDITVRNIEIESGAVLTHGEIDGHPHSMALFSSFGNALSGIIHAPDGRYFFIYPAIDGNHVFRSLIQELIFAKVQYLRTRTVSVRFGIMHSQQAAAWRVLNISSLSRAHP
jgi:hypothetical protein